VVDLGALRGKLDGLEIGEITCRPSARQHRLDPHPAAAGRRRGDPGRRHQAEDHVGDQWTTPHRDGRPQGRRGAEVERVWASLLAMLGIMGYVWFAMNGNSGVNALLALFHDCVTTVACSP